MFQPTNDYKEKLKEKIRKGQPLTLLEQGLNEKGEVIADYPILVRLFENGCPDPNGVQDRNGNLAVIKEIQRQWMEVRKKIVKSKVQMIARRRDIYFKAKEEVRQEWASKRE